MLTPNRWATSDSLRPWDRSSTMRARRASRWLEVGEADLCRSSALSSGVISTEATGRAMPQYGTVWRFITSYFTDRTLAIWTIAHGNTSAQSIYGSIRGLVTDPTSAAVASGRVTLINEGTSAQRFVLSNNFGEYVFSQVVPGT